MSTHSEEDLRSHAGKEFETGLARIWSEPATDLNSHGTDITLMHLLPKTRDDLASADRWIQSHDDSYLLDEGDTPLPPPRFHIGCVVTRDRTKIRQQPNLPWKDTDSSSTKFKKLVEAVKGETGVSSQNPKLVDLLDNYLRLLWTLGLQVPVKYIGRHPFAICGKDPVRTFEVGNKSGSRAREINLKRSETLSDRLHLEAVDLQKNARIFQVFIDGIQILRPLEFHNKHLVEHTIKESLVFVGKDKPSLAHIPPEIRGGSLDFEGYLFWQPKVVPVEHRGVLVRINNANGTLFDETFMKYPISEQTRKNQITAEIFVKEGMDAALNIDRESFNYAHPHYQYLSKWLHNAFKQFATAHKKIGKDLRDKHLLSRTAKKFTGLDKLVVRKIEEVRPQNDDSRTPVEISNSPLKDVTSERRKGRLVYAADKILPASSRSRVTNKHLADTLLLQKKITAIAELLAAYGLFDDMSYERQEHLLKAIAEIVGFES